MSYRSGRHFLQIPGPSNTPERILRAIDSAGWIIEALSLG